MMMKTICSTRGAVVLFFILCYFILHFWFSNYSNTPQTATTTFTPPPTPPTPPARQPQELLFLAPRKEEIKIVKDPKMIEKYLRMVRNTVLGLSLRTKEKSIPSMDDVTVQRALKEACETPQQICTPSDQKNADGTPVITCKRTPLAFNPELRRIGGDWPLIGITMVGEVRLDNLRSLLEDVINNKIEGDFVECGVWRGGASIFAKAVLDTFDEGGGRQIWVVDSFQGLPPARTSKDTNYWSTLSYISVPLDEVQENFRAFDLLDDKVNFCKGYFVDSLPTCGCRKRKIAVLRMDGDMYESTMDQMFNLYEQVALDGYIIIDDWDIKFTRDAVFDFFKLHNVMENITVLEDQRGAIIKKKTQIQTNYKFYQDTLLVKQNKTL